MPLSTYFTNSEFQTFKQCKRKWYLGNYRKLATRSRYLSKPLNVGTLVHEAVRVFYRGNSDVAATLAWLEKQKAIDIDQAFLADRAQVQDAHELARAVVEGYIWWLENTGADHKLIIEAVEKAYEVDGPVPGTKLLAKIDMLGRDIQTGDLVLVDHKTLDAFARVVPTLNLNEQGPYYALIRSIAEPDAKPVTKIVWNLMRKVKRGPKSKPPYFAREEIYVTPAMLDRMWQQIYGQIHDIHEAERRLDSGESHQVVAYPTPSQDCSWKCQFFGVCGLLNDPASDAEDVLAYEFEVVDPLKRYAEDLSEEQV